MRLKIFLWTVGERITLESLDLLVRHTPKPYELVVWYDACGRGVDLEFLRAVNKYTDDTIVVSKDKNSRAAWSFASLNLEFDRLIICAADLLVLPGYYERLIEPFHTLDKVACVGEAWRPSLGKEWAISDDARGIDGIVCVSSEAINDVGSVSPAFNGRGPYHQEWFRRFSKNGWKSVAMDGLCVHGGLQHEGRDMDPDWQKDLHKDNLAWLESERLGHTGFKWWERNINKWRPVTA